MSSISSGDDRLEEEQLEEEQSDATQIPVEALLMPVGERRLRRLPFLVWTAIRLTKEAGRRPMTIAVILQVVAGVAVLIQLLIARQLLLRLTSGQGSEAFRGSIALLGAFAGITAIILLSNLVQGEVQNLLGELVSLHTVDMVLDVSTRTDLLQFEDANFHDRLVRAMVNASARPLQMVSGLLTILGSLIAVGGVATALLLVQPVLFVALVVAYIPAWLATTRASRETHRFSLEQTERDRRRQYISFLMIQREAAAEVRAFSLSKYLRERHDRLWAERISELRQAIRRRLFVGVIGGLVSAALTAATIGLLVWLVATNHIALAEGGVAAGAVLVLGQQLQSLSRGMGSLYESSLFLEDFASFVPEHAAARPADDAPEETGGDPIQFRTISTERLSFTYPTRSQPSLCDVELRIQAGEVVALVGENGSGKTTLAKLLAGLYTPTIGSVRWDDADVASLDSGAVRATCGVIFQDFVKYYLSAAENIGLGRPDAMWDTDRLVEAARRAGAYQFLSELSAGLDTTLGSQFSQSTELSGGQWQRVALARAFFRDAPFLILDEPTAALDPRSEAALFTSIRELYRGRTVLLISHRFATVRSADRIFVLDNGRIVESGRHEELMAHEGLYAEMFTLQASAYLG